MKCVSWRVAPRDQLGYKNQEEPTYIALLKVVYIHLNRTVHLSSSLIYNPLRSPTASPGRQYEARHFHDHQPQDSPEIACLVLVAHSFECISRIFHSLLLSRLDSLRHSYFLLLLGLGHGHSVDFGLLLCDLRC
jgi:hypothetical protein